MIVLMFTPDLLMYRKKRIYYTKDFYCFPIIFHLFCGTSSFTYEFKRFLDGGASEGTSSPTLAKFIDFICLKPVGFSIGVSSTK